MHVRLKDKGQVTIPASVRSAIDATVGDVFEVALDDGNIILRPQQMSRKAPSKTKSKAKGVDIAGWIGSGKGLFKTVDEVDAFIRAERDRWE
jgi:AbrB family looped-hinge helix DNA binding protein